MNKARRRRVSTNNWPIIVVLVFAGVLPNVVVVVT